MLERDWRKKEEELFFEKKKNSRITEDHGRM
jgi:hypothetical protein